MKTIMNITLLFVTTLLMAQKELPLHSTAPDISGVDQYGNLISLEKELKKGPLVIIFYRGEWCPHCNLYMNYFADSIDQITALGAKVIAITPENTKNIQKTIGKTDAAFSIIYDENHKIMDDYRVTFKLGWGMNLMYNSVGININKASGNEDRALPVPATYIINTDGKIIASHFNEDYTLRMPVKHIINVLKNNTGGIVNN